MEALPLFFGDMKRLWLINGPPGARKTILTDVIKETLTEDYKVYKCLAPAALKINGTTIHKFSCILNHLWNGDYKFEAQLQTI